LPSLHQGCLIPSAVALTWHGRRAREACTHAGRSYSTDKSKSAALRCTDRTDRF
jgi:hypothetical protein